MGSKKGMSRKFRCSTCGKDYAIEQMLERHKKVYQH